MEACDVLARLIIDRAKTVSPTQKLPLLYLIDSITKNIGGRYCDEFARNIVSCFCDAYEKADDKTRSSLRHLLDTWDSVYPAAKVHSIRLQLNLRAPPRPTPVVQPTGPLLNPSLSGPSLQDALLRQISQILSSPNPQLPPGLAEQLMIALGQAPAVMPTFQSPQMDLSQIMSLLQPALPQAPPPVMMNPLLPIPTPLPALQPVPTPGPLLPQPSSAHSAHSAHTAPNTRSRTAQKRTTVKDDVAAVSAAFFSAHIRDDNAIRALYDRFPLNCKQCGLRMMEGMQEHLDWHFKEKRRARERGKHATCRNWFLSRSKWEAYDFDASVAQQEAPAFFQQMAVVGAGGSSNVTPVPEATHEVVAGEQRSCPVCTENFDMHFDDDQQEWMLSGAVKIDDVVYHVACAPGPMSISVDTKRALDSSEMSDAKRIKTGL
eukprot:TRINITY_DN4009_c0_g1_i2.p1 TRINITY_DN4009_c0_g1~~TRINITY_DN4009_c0_g1_i2.p1  ORF type:complete len:473 (+),score=41.62 TRINITY_DN4009_c0_g1_i2:126-1421(+)